VILDLEMLPVVVVDQIAVVEVMLVVIDVNK
jgi:hypothetical protein